MGTTQKRRSDRLMLTIPLLARGIDAGGKGFETSAHTITLSQNGAQVHIPYPLRSGQTIHLINLAAHCEADFRVVESVPPSVEDGGEYGVECLEPNKNIWRILFFAPEEGEAAEAKALLECRICRTLALTKLSVGEVQLLRTAGVAAKRCHTCNASTPWKYAEISPAEQGIGWGSMVAGPAQQRRHRRICMQLPIGVRDRHNGVEFTRTENVSRGGFCFTSKRKYQAGQNVVVALASDPLTGKAEIAAQIVWQQQVGKLDRRIYGMRTW